MLRVWQVPPGRRSRAAQHQLIVLAACGADETLPLSPEVPADLFTSCLTTPIQTALRWLVCNNKTVMAQLGGDLKILDEIKGNVSNRRTPLGELNWVLTAITDSIAWNVLPTAIFQRLFRLDILVSCLFRNFLLADRYVLFAVCSRLRACVPVCVWLCVCVCVCGYVCVLGVGSPGHPRVLHRAAHQQKCNELESKRAAAQRLVGVSGKESQLAVARSEVAMVRLRCGRLAVRLWLRSLINFPPLPCTGPKLCGQGEGRAGRGQHTRAGGSGALQAGEAGRLQGCAVGLRAAADRL